MGWGGEVTDLEKKIEFIYLALKCSLLKIVNKIIDADNKKNNILFLFEAYGKK